MNKKEQAMSLRQQGWTYQQIGNELGCSRQRIAQILGKQAVWGFQYINTEECVYPKLAEWMNKNKVSRSEFLRRIGLQAEPRNIIRFSSILCGRIDPRKTDIDRYLNVTGMTYEELFEVI